MTLRPELEPLPYRMQDLPVDRGYPVPWFVEWIRGETGELVPEFRAVTKAKWVTAVNQRRCWVCGKRLGVNLAFLIGPMCGINRTTSEPPCHLDCAEWSARNCPFLSRPHAVRREPDHPDFTPGPGEPILRNPGVSLVWVTRSYKVFEDGKGGHLIRIGNPDGVGFWYEGKPATRAQINESIRTGLPSLEATVETPDDRLQLLRCVVEFERMLPAA